MNFQSFLTLLGLFISFIGSCIFSFDLFFSKKQALELGLSRLSAETDEENLRLPQVQNLLKLSRHAKWAFGLISLGFLFQFLAVIIGLGPISAWFR